MFQFGGFPAYDAVMSRIGPFADDDAAAWVVKSPDIGVAMAGFTHAVYNKNRLPMRVRELARMVIALDLKILALTVVAVMRGAE